MGLTFLHPEYLWALFIVPCIVLFHFFSLKTRKTKALQFANFEAIARVKGIDIYSKNVSGTFLTIAALVLVIGAVSGPQINTNVEVSKFSIVIAVDVSRSMEANDLFPSRIAVAKETARNFVSSLPEGSRVGVVAFSGNSFIRSDVSDKKNKVLEAVDGIAISPLGGTDSYEAVITSTNLLIREPYRAVVFLSDGQSNVGNLDDAVDYAVQNSVVVYSVGIGTEKGGETSYGFSKLDEDSLKALAYNTKGEYFRAENRSNLEESFRKIEMIKEANVEKDISDKLLVAALILLIAEYFISNGIYRSFP